MARARVLIISILGTPEVMPRNPFGGCAEGSSDLEWVERRLEQIGLRDRLELDFVDISRGEGLPAPSKYDGVVVGGSIHNANEGHGWQHALFDWLRDWRHTGRPLFGICGGHQHAAIALGGEVSVHPQGPFAETATLEVSETGRQHFLFRQFDAPPRVHLGHFDHVTRLPEASEVLATYGDTVQAVDMGGNWITVQFHPEASPGVMIAGWDNQIPDLDKRYQPAGTGRRLFENFFKGTALVS